MKKDNNIPDLFALDSARHIDANGFLHVVKSPLTKETVNPYRGAEVPGWEGLGLDPDKIYNGYRSGAELEKAVSTFNGIPLLIAHELDSAEAPLKDERIGSVGTNAKWQAPYIMNALTVTDKRAIKAIESGRQKELSACYRYTPVMEQGVFEGMNYDFIMTNIEANHVAIVDEGRAGKDVYVFDSVMGGYCGKPSPKKDTILKEQNMPKKVEELREAAKGFMQALNAFLDEEAGESAHAADDDGGFKDAMGKAGCDGEDVDQQKAFAEGVKYGEGKGKQEQVAGNDGGFKDAMGKAGCDGENVGQQKAFAEGVKYGESKEKPEPKTNDNEHESPGEKKAEDAETAKDKKIAMDGAILKAKHETRSETIAFVKDIFAAAEDVRGTVAIKQPLAYDSAEQIYKKALDIEGVGYKGVSPVAYRSLYLAVKGSKDDSMPAGFAKDEKLAETSFSKNIKIED